ncbi:hypothetical protein [Nocardia africana]|uniref:Uncharacterized protein n=1 Tax=Nocardia africana TaxID=134964 RepID=A0A378X3X9_9NOCA|nr:hypothetical protein [Nocardia africana]MCC3311495.1 hypothetical protein [Nocardia africana]SUA47243.1 Uncharacterised protein [Nocardia africana]
MPDTERPALADVIAAAIEYAVSAGFDARELTPDDFALQRSPAGWSHATYVGTEFVITATIDADRVASTDVGWVDWLNPDDDGGAEDEPDDGMVDIYLPGDAPANAVPPTPEQIDEVLHVTAVRDENGAIRRRDGTYIADADTTVEQLREKIVAHLGETSNRAVYLCRNYQAAIDLLTSERAAAVSADA